MFTKRHSVLILLFLAALLFSSCTIRNEALYPFDYREYIEKYCDEYSVPYELASAVIRVESSFDKDAVSKAGAVGLMQLLPSTAEELAGRMGEEFVEEDLKSPETNIKYGCYYLSYLYRNTGENWDTACAAYNAGIGRVKAWLADEKYSDDGRTLKEIPIEETKDYVNKINKYKVKYKELYFSDKGESDE